VSVHYKDHRRTLINNKSSAQSRDECDSVLNNQSDSLGATNHENQVSKYVILNIDKSTLEYKNNKNLILKQASIERNRFESHGKLLLNNNNINRSMIHETHHNFEKHLNDINQLKKELQEKRFISPSDMCDNLNSSVPHAVPKIEAFHVKGTGQLSIDQAANDYRVVYGAKAGQPLKSLEKAEGIDKNGSSRASLAAMRTNILRQKRNPSNRFASSNGHAANENHFHGISLHESPKNTTNAKSVPCIVIQGNASDLNNKTFNGAAERAGSLSGKLLCSSLAFISFTSPPSSIKMFQKQESFGLYCVKMSLHLTHSLLCCVAKSS
jgi:hypothetical protein